MKSLATLVLVSCVLIGCNRASQSQEAIRAGVIDYVATKVADPASGFQMRYTLEQKAGKWVVKDKAQAGGSPHGAAVNPGGQPASPHGSPGAGQVPPGHPPLDPGEAKRLIEPPFWEAARRALSPPRS